MELLYLLIIYFEEAISDVIFYNTLKGNEGSKKAVLKRFLTYILIISLFGFICEINIESFLLLKTLHILCSLFCISFLVHSDISETITLYTLDFAIIYLIQDALALVLSLFPIDISDMRVGILANLLTIIILAIIRRYTNIRSLYNILISKKHVTRIIIVNLFLFFQIIDYYFKARKELYDINLFFIISSMLIIIVLNFLIVYEEQKVSKSNLELELSKRNSLLMNSMIAEVRRVQHQYDDRINSIASLAVVCNDIDTLKSKLLEYTDKKIIEPENYELLKLDHKLVSALLYSKANQAKDKGIKMLITINSYDLSSQANEMDLVDILSILINNMLDACVTDDPCSITIENTDDRLSITTKNIGPKLDVDLQKSLFKDGYSTKSNEDSKHGHGLYNLKKLVQQYEGSFGVYNEFVDNKTFILFKVEV